MNITEKDIYKFVFYKSELSQEKQNFISKNLEKFSSSIELLNEIKSASETDISPIIMKRITDLIEKNQSNEKIVLTPISFNDCSDYLILAADSKSNESNEKTQTFTDTGNNYIAKIVTENRETKLFLFANTNLANKNISLTIYPSKQKYNLESSESNCIVLNKQRIEKIVIN